MISHFYRFAIYNFKTFFVDLDYQIPNFKLMLGKEKHQFLIFQHHFQTPIWSAVQDMRLKWSSHFFMLIKQNSRKYIAWSDHKKTCMMASIRTTYQSFRTCWIRLLKTLDDVVLEVLNHENRLYNRNHCITAVQTRFVSLLFTFSYPSIVLLFW